MKFLARWLLTFVSIWVIVAMYSMSFVRWLASYLEELLLSALDEIGGVYGSLR